MMTAYETFLEIYHAHHYSYILSCSMRLKFCTASALSLFSQIPSFLHLIFHLTPKLSVMVALLLVKEGWMQLILELHLG